MWNWSIRIGVTTKTSTTMFSNENQSKTDIAAY